jgi:hypothetical protein
MIILALGKDLTKNGVSSGNSNQYLQSVKFMNYSYCHKIVPTKHCENNKGDKK